MTDIKSLKHLPEGERIERLIERDDALAQLEEVRHTNILNIAADRKTNYEMRFGIKGLDEPWMFMSSSYYGTGEGQTVCLMITQALPTAKDLSPEDPYGVPGNDREYRAVREFMDEFGTWHCHGLDFHTEEDFLREWSQYLPPILSRIGKKCFFHFYTQVHYNYS